MGLLLYSQEPSEQFLKNSSFEKVIGTETPILDNWYTSGEVIRQSEIVAFGNFAAKLTDVCSLIQESRDLIRTGLVTISILSRGSSSNQVGQLNLTYDFLDINKSILLSKSIILRSPVATDFNNVSASFNIPVAALSAVTARITYSVTGVGTYYLDNSKLENNPTSTRWSPFPGETGPEVPAIFSQPPPVTADPFFTDNNPINLGPSSSFPPPDITLEEGDIPIGEKGKGDKCIKEYKEFMKALRRIIRQVADQGANKEEMQFFPKKEDVEFLEFKRLELQNCLGEKQKLTAIQRGWISFSNNKIAALQRVYEKRIHSPKDKIAMGFITSWLNDRYSRDEKAIVEEFMRD